MKRERRVGSVERGVESNQGVVVTEDERVNQKSLEFSEEE